MYHIALTTDKLFITKNSLTEEILEKQKSKKKLFVVHHMRRTFYHTLPSIRKFPYCTTYDGEHFKNYLGWSVDTSTR